MSVIKPTLQQPDQIAYFAGANNYCWTYFRDGKKKLLAKPISYLETLLPDFIRVHKTALVNPSYVKTLLQPPRRKMNGEIHLDGGTVLPVSRRRLDYVVERLQNFTQPDDNEHIERSLSTATPLTEPAAPVIYLTTTHRAMHDLAHDIFRKNWSSYNLYIDSQSAFLPQLLQSLPEREFPTLLLLDARTATSERLRTLSELKTNRRHCSIPVILFVAPTDQAVISGYQHQANSVISLPVDSTIPDEMFKRICQFWLHMVELPIAEHEGNWATETLVTAGL